MRRDLRSFGWGNQEFRAFVASVGWTELLPKLPVERILLIAASEEHADAQVLVNLEETVRRAMWFPEYLPVRYER